MPGNAEAGVTLFSLLRQRGSGKLLSGLRRESCTFGSSRMNFALKTPDAPVKQIYKLDVYKHTH